MQRKFVSAIIFPVIILVTMLACDIGSTVPGPSSAGAPATGAPGLNTGDACANPLYPVKQGATWTYASSGSPAGPFSYTDTITEVRADGFMLSSQFTGLSRTQEWTCKPEGLLALTLGGSNAGGITTQGLTAEFTTSDIKGVSIPVNVTPGMQWAYEMKMQGTMAMPGDQNARSNGIVLMNMQEIGMESVTVPAGTFTATKVQAASNFDIIASFQGMDIPVKFSGATILWYAPAVGLVKSVENGDFGGTAYTSTTELQSYSIP